MYLIVNIVTNHMRYIDSGHEYNDYSQFVPFDHSIYFHSYYNYGDNSDSTSSCIVGCGTTDCNVNDWDSIESQVCRSNFWTVML